MRVDEDVSRDEIRERAGDPAFVLVDVLPAESFAEGHIPGSLSLPVSEIEGRAREVLPNLSQEIVVYCAAFT